ncbi:flagellar filament capping protein FliD [Roseburia intestinalis]|uniref:flagellar filament capping protein FliD n=1 Tax=Roseburia intestinalis TaxID=166486 RepID=UPI00201B5EEF|nr:flagellar filament capping protein FliD [Roseburia intestinalis]UQT30228.1 flagellar filament capping protein FliD [Roseburia intestinalis]
MPIRITGLASGLDTESIISALVSSYNYKTNKYKKAQTKLSWKQDAWKSLNTKIYSLYSSVGSMKLSTAYNLKSTTVSDSTKATVKAGNNAPTGTQQLNILKVAQAGYLTGAQLSNSTTTSTTLAELGYTGGDAKINLTKGDGTTKEITLTQGSTVGDVIASLKDAGVSANFDETNHRIFISSKDTGKDNDFTLTGGNTEGARALYQMGLAVGSDATNATYKSYTQYYDADGNKLQQNVVDAIRTYQDAKTAYETASAQNTNLTSAYGYATAYSEMQDALKNSGLTTDEQKKLTTLLGMSATQRVNSVMDASGNVYTKSTTLDDGSTIYEYGSGNDKKYIQAITTAKDDHNNIYTKNADGNYVDSGAGLVYKATGEKDSDGNTYYVYTASDGQEAKIAMKDETTNYYQADVAQKGYTEYTDNDGIVYRSNEKGNYTGSDGKTYKLENNTFTEIDSDGNAVSNGRTATVTEDQKKEVKTTYSHGNTALSDTTRAADLLSRFREDHKDTLTDDVVSKLTSNIEKVNVYESAEDSLDDTDTYSKKNIISSIQQAYQSGGASAVTEVTNKYAEKITENQTAMTTAQKKMDDNSVLADLAAMDSTSSDYTTALAAFVNKVQDSQRILDQSSTLTNSGAKKIDGCDSEIKLNGITYTSSLNTYSINGLSITAMQATGDGDTNAITVTTATDTQAIYDKIKSFLTQYNSLINEMTSLYNADTAKGYEPLTDDEKSAMSDSEVEKWEEKIKSSLLRRDDSLESVMNLMTNAMSQPVTIDGKKYYLSSFGIKTLGFLNAPENQQNAYHIDGDEDDTATSGNEDKLMAMINSDPDTVVSFMQQLTTNLYDAIGTKMKSSTLSSIYKVYNDKEMASEYSDYTTTIKKWEQKLQDQEDAYYKKFSAMETALSKLQSQTSSLSNLFGG